MAIEPVKESYTGKIQEVTIGTGSKAIKVGGESCYPFYVFEGKMPNPPRIAFEIWDADTESWPPFVREPYSDVLNDLARWAKKDVEKYGAEILCLRLQSTDPNGKNAPAESVIPSVEAVLNAVDVPLIVAGVSNAEKDREVLRLVAEKFQGKNLVIWPVEEANHKQLGAVNIGFGHVCAASTPIDINLAKQLNTLLENLGVKPDRIIMDPTTGALGYGIEYTYSVMERDRMAALVQQDEKMQKPLINFVGREVWKIKEVSQELSSLGDPNLRGIIYEAITAIMLLLAGSDIVVMRHPEAIAYTKKVIAELLE